MSVQNLTTEREVTNARETTVRGGSEEKKKFEWIVLAALALGFALRWKAALGTYLNPDEALHYALINQTSVWKAYLASLTNAHPPLYFVFLYFWHFVGNSEFMLRLPSVVAGTAACWLAYRWAALAIHRAAGLVTLLLLTFSPVLIRLGGEVRDYSLLILCMAGALYFLERAFRDQKISSIAWSSLFLYLAILTHYSALWFVLSIGCYGLVRLPSLAPRLRVVWAGSQLVGAAMYVWLYVTHISKIHESPMETEAMTGWLSAEYLRAGQNPLEFLVHATLSVFQFLFASVPGGNAALLLWIGGVLGVLIRSAVKRRGRQAAFGLLLLLPFAFGMSAALLDLYPYGGTRHNIYLILFAAAGVAIAVSTLLLESTIPILVVAAIALPYSYLHPLPDPQQMDRAEQKVELMRDVLSYVRTSVRPAEPIFTDYQASILLAYYLGRDQPPAPPVSCAGLSQVRYGPYSVVVIDKWSATAAELEGALQSWRAACDPTPRDSYWVFDAGWGLNLLDDLKQSAPGSISEARKYAQTISLFRAAVRR